MNEDNAEFEMRSSEWEGDHAEEIPPAADDGHPLLDKGGNEEGGLRDAGSKMRAHLSSLYEQAAELTREIPDFSLSEAMRDPDFLRLTSPAVGVSVRRAWYALHGAERERQAARRASEDAASALARSAARPREGGRGLNSGTLSAADPRAMDRAGRAALRQRVYDAAARGEKIYPR